MLFDVTEMMAIFSLDKIVGQTLIICMDLQQNVD